jgi:2'-5' RNA ligase
MTMNNFFARVESRATAPWPRGRRDLHWHILFDSDEVRRTLTDPYHELTHMPGLEAVTPEWVHVTVLHMSPADDASDAEVDKMIALVREHASHISPFEMQIERPAVGTVALECLARPGEPARELWRRTADAMRQTVGGRWPIVPATYYPHASLAYAGEDAELADRQALKMWLSDHGPEPVTLRAEKLSLVAQWHDGRHITWDHIADVPLGGTR